MKSNQFLDIENGYGVYKNMLSSKSINLLIEAYDELNANITPSKQILYTHRLPKEEKPALSKIANQWFNLFSKGIKTNLDSCYEELKNRLSAIGLNGFILFQDSIIQKVKTTTPFHWHQDAPYWPVDKPNGWTVWVALDEVNETNGKLDIAVGSNNLGSEKAVDLHNGNIQHTDRKPNFNPLEFDTYSPNLVPGDAIFFHGLTYHFSTPNITSTPRRAWASVWLQDGAVWDKSIAPRHFLCSKINSGDAILDYLDKNHRV